MIEDADALYQTICDQPHEDTPRLVYADKLDESDPFDPLAEAKRAHAKLIRTQLGVYNLPFCELCLGTGVYKKRETTTGYDRMARRVRRTGPMRRYYCNICPRGPARKECQSLLKTVVVEKPKDVLPTLRKRVAGKSYTGTLADYICLTVPYHPNILAVEIKRGFIDSISIDMISFMDPRQGYRDCFASRLFRSCPLSRVHLHDRRPYDPERHGQVRYTEMLKVYGFWWAQVTYGVDETSFGTYPPFILTPTLYSCLTSVSDPPWFAEHAGFRRRLEWAAVLHGRGQAGLSYIPPDIINPVVMANDRQPLRDYVLPKFAEDNL